jgi:hypothetical protein
VKPHHLNYYFFMHICSLILKKIKFLLLLLMICLCYFNLMRLSWLLYLYKFIKWKTIYEIKKIIEFNILHDMRCKFGWFTRIHVVFFFIYIYNWVIFSTIFIFEHWVNKKFSFSVFFLRLSPQVLHVNPGYKFNVCFYCNIR